MISFQWMVREAEKAGLLVDDAKMNALLAHAVRIRAQKCTNL